MPSSRGGTSKPCGASGVTSGASSAYAKRSSTVQAVAAHECHYDEDTNQTKEPADDALVQGPPPPRDLDQQIDPMTRNKTW